MTCIVRFSFKAVLKVNGTRNQRTFAMTCLLIVSTVKPVLSGHSIEDQKIGFQDRLTLNAGQKGSAGQKYCRMLQWVAFCNTFGLHLGGAFCNTFDLH